MDLIDPITAKFMQQSEQRRKKKWAKLSISSLEADVAYFDARLALLNQKTTSYYQLAQLRAYTELEQVLSEILGRLRMPPKKGSGSSGIEVSMEKDTSLLHKVLADDSHPPPSSSTSVAEE